MVAWRAVAFLGETEAAIAVTAGPGVLPETIDLLICFVR